MSNETTTATVTPATSTVVAPKATKARKTRKGAKAKAAPKGPKLVLAKNRRKSHVDGPVGEVHAFLDEHPKMKRSEAIAALEEEGIAYYTARTQFQVWFAARKARKGKRKAKSSKVAPKQSVAAVA